MTRPDVITIMAMVEEWPEARRGVRKAWLPHGDIGDRANQKRRGEIAEAMFLTKAVTMGFSVGVLWGDSDRYDLIVDAGAGLLRVQVKSAHRVSASKGGGYHVRAHGHQRKSYRASEIDLLVAYVVPEDAWYVFPPRAFVTMKSMRLFPRPGKKKSKFEEYREAWGWFQKR
ncbi:MAG: group I intron-associated PD-(D/E)XK endonuclease [Candidatus Sulfotelmatobacter sp.]